MFFLCYFLMSVFSSTNNSILKSYEKIENDINVITQEIKEMFTGLIETLETDETPGKNLNTILDKIKKMKEYEENEHIITIIILEMYKANEDGDALITAKVEDLYGVLNQLHEYVTVDLGVITTRLCDFSNAVIKCKNLKAFLGNMNIYHSKSYRMIKPGLKNDEFIRRTLYFIVKLQIKRIRNLKTDLITLREQQNREIQNPKIIQLSGITEDDTKA